MATKFSARRPHGAVDAQVAGAAELVERLAAITAAEHRGSQGDELPPAEVDAFREVDFAAVLERSAELRVASDDHDAARRRRRGDKEGEERVGAPHTAKQEKFV